MLAAKENVLKTIEENKLLSKGDYIVLGLSGGPDSLCLFDILWSIRKRMELGFYVVHINHGFRGKDSDEDQTFVENLCKKAGIKCKSIVADCNALARQKKISGEEAGRLVRYENFRKAAEELKKSGIPGEKIKIAVAQNKNDQAETILFRIIRGTGIDGLSAMSYTAKDKSNFNIIRPLLDTDRSSIEEYIEINKLSPRIDKTNYEPLYSRNKIRLNIIPYINEIFDSNISESLVRLGKLAKVDCDYLTDIAEATFKKVSDGGGVLNRYRLSELDDAILSRVIKLACASKGLREDVGFSHINSVIKLIRGMDSGGHADLPSGYSVEVAYDAVEVINGNESKMANPGVKTKIMPVGDYIPKAFVAAFDFEKLKVNPENVVVRKRKAGDYIKLKVGEKSIQNLFVDMKVPGYKRNHIDLVCVGSQVLWIPHGLKKPRFCEVAGVGADTKKVMTLEMTNCI